MVQTLVVLLAVFGGVALVYRFVRAVARFGLSFAEATTARGLAEVSARRGDLTGLAERQASTRSARRRQWKDAGFVLLWLLWLLLPPLTALTQPLYAAAVALWLLPYRSIRPSP